MDTQVNPPTLFKALIADAVVDRANGFLLSGRNYSLSIVRTEAALAKAVEEQVWDVVFLSLYLGSWDRHLASVNDIVQAHKLGKVKLVIVYCPIMAAGAAFMDEMKLNKIPAKWYPYNYNHPSRHEEKKVNG